MKLHDITRPLRDDIACWPGDTPAAFELAASQNDGSSVNVGAIRSSVHNATHADAPFHVDTTARTIDRLDLKPFIGPAVVVDARGRETIEADVLDDVELQTSPRLLFRTDGWLVDTIFPTRIAVMSPATIDRLASGGVLLVGVDVPSVDAINSKDLPNHHALNRADIRIVESLDLRDVAAGSYELFAQPIKIAGADGAFVRAVLREAPV